MCAFLAKEGKQGSFQTKPAQNMSQKALCRKCETDVMFAPLTSLSRVCIPDCHMHYLWEGQDNVRVLKRKMVM